MRKYFVTAAVLGAGFTLGVLFVGVPIAVRAGVGGGSVVSTGDTNGDGVVDISDAVFTLLYLFKGGQEPVACADSPEILGRVAALEDTNVRIASALEELAHPCRDRTDRFQDNGDGTVTDTCSGLMWQQDGSHVFGTVDAARQYCDGLELGGHGDWRLPAIHELDGLVRRTGYGPANVAGEYVSFPIFHVSSRRPYLSSTLTMDGGVWYQSFTLNWGQDGIRPFQSVYFQTGGEAVLAVRGP